MAGARLDLSWTALLLLLLSSQADGFSRPQTTCTRNVDLRRMTRSTSLSFTTSNFDDVSYYNTIDRRPYGYYESERAFVPHDTTATTNEQYYNPDACFESPPYESLYSDHPLYDSSSNDDWNLPIEQPEEYQTMHYEGVNQSPERSAAVINRQEDKTAATTTTPSASKSPSPWNQYTDPYNQRSWYLPDKEQPEQLNRPAVHCEFVKESPEGNRKTNQRHVDKRTSGSATESAEADRIVAAGLGTGVLASMVAGPIGGVVAGFSAAYAAEFNEHGDIAGDSARAVGEVALEAKNKSLELNSKHHVMDKTLAVAEEAWEKAKELDREHHLVQKAKDVAIYGSTATVDFVKRHNLVERGLQGIGTSVGWLTERVVAGSLSGGEEQNVARRPSSYMEKKSSFKRNTSPSLSGSTKNLPLFTSN